MCLVSDQTLWRLSFDLTTDISMLQPSTKLADFHAVPTQLVFAARIILVALYVARLTNYLHSERALPLAICCLRLLVTRRSSNAGSMLDLSGALFSTFY